MSTIIRFYPPDTNVDGTSIEYRLLFEIAVINTGNGVVDESTVYRIPSSSVSPEDDTGAVEADIEPFVDSIDAGTYTLAIRAVNAEEEDNVGEWNRADTLALTVPDETPDKVTGLSLVLDDASPAV